MVTHPTDNSTKFVVRTLRMGNFYMLSQEDGGNVEFAIEISGDHARFRDLMDKLGEQQRDGFSGTFRLIYNEQEYVMDSTLWTLFLNFLRTHFDFIES